MFWLAPTKPTIQDTSDRAAKNTAVFADVSAKRSMLLGHTNSATISIFRGPVIRDQILG
jgi:hypothetical protein